MTVDMTAAALAASVLAEKEAIKALEARYQTTTIGNSLGSGPRSWATSHS